MRDRVRVTRLLIYEGDVNWVEDTLNNNMVPLDGIRKLANGNSIRSILLVQEEIDPKDGRYTYSGKEEK